MKGQHCGIFESKSIGNCSMDGISARCKSVTLIGDGIAGVFEPDADAPAVKLVYRNIFGKEYVHAEPVEDVRSGNVGWMAGGSFIYTSDGRFPSQYPIALHDRQETQAQYDQLSR